MTAAKTKTTRTRAAKPAAAKVEAKTEEVKNVLPGMPDFEAFKFPEMKLGDFPMFDMSKFDFGQGEWKAFDFSSAEVPAYVRDMAEKTVAQTKEVYAKVKATAEEGMDVIEDSLEASRDGALEVQLKSIDNTKANTDAVYDFWKDLFSVKSVSEAVELQTSFARQQYEMLSAQTKDMQELATKAVTEAVKPAKTAVEKAMKAA